jgi:hypothetical protein
VDPWNDLHSQLFVHARFLYDQHCYPEAFTGIQRGILRARGESHPDNSCLRQVQHDVGFADWRMFCHKVLLVLPPTDCVLGSWIARANEALAAIEKLGGCELKVKRRSPKCNYPDIPIAALFQESPDSVFRCDTIHGVKGATFEAVMVVLKRRTGSTQYYRTLLASKAFSDEEIRIVYVGLTRPRKLLVLCVPSADRDAWAHALGVVQ